MSTLHLLSHSPFNDSRLSSCLRLLGADDAIVLCGDAVYALQSGSAPCAALAEMPERNALFALAEDLQSRGIDPVLPRVGAIDYPALVALCTRYSKVNSWL